MSDDVVVRANNHTTRWLDLQGVVNARTVVPGVLLRSDNLQSLTDSDVRRLIDHEGLQVVLDLRTDHEVRLEGPGPMTREAAIRIEHRSLFPDSGGNTDLETEPVNPWNDGDDPEHRNESPVVRAYMSYLRRRPDSIVASIRTIARADGAVLVHCAAGKDRTGVVVSVALDAAGIDRETIVGDYMATAERIEAILNRLVSSETYRHELEGHDPRRHAPVPQTLSRMFELIEKRYGGSTAWLLEHGLESGDLELLKHRLAAPCK